MVRVIFELSGVNKGDGGTHFIVGSHKANFPMHEAHLSLKEGRRSPFLMTYECPPGSALFFTENVCHAGPVWQRDTPRVTILHAYSHLATHWHRLKYSASGAGKFTPRKTGLFQAAVDCGFLKPDRRHTILWRGLLKEMIRLWIQPIGLESGDLNKLDVLPRLKSRDSGGHPLSGGLPRNLQLRAPYGDQTPRPRGRAERPLLETPDTCRWILNAPTRSAWPSKPQQQEYQPRCLRLNFFLILHCGQVCEVYFSQTTLTFMPRSAALYSIIALSLSYGQACRR